jgi:hypothetical protein
MITREIKVGDRLQWDNDKSTTWFTVAKIDGDYLIDRIGNRWLVTPGNRSQYNHVDEPQADPVNHPPHYTQGDIECIDAIRAALGRDGFVAYCRGNAMKYSWRYRHKGGVEDLHKAEWYINRANQEQPE